MDLNLPASWKMSLVNEKKMITVKVEYQRHTAVLGSNNIESFIDKHSSKQEIKEQLMKAYHSLLYRLNEIADKTKGITIPQEALNFVKKKDNPTDVKRTTKAKAKSAKSEASPGATRKRKQQQPKENETNDDDNEDDEIITNYKFGLPTSDELREYVKSQQSSEQVQLKQREIINNLAQEHFDEWLKLLYRHHNVLCYGYGCKRALLTKFIEECLIDEDVIEVNYESAPRQSPRTTIVNICDSISTIIGTSKDKSKTRSARSGVAWNRSQFSQQEKNGLIDSFQIQRLMSDLCKFYGYGVSNKTDELVDNSEYKNFSRAHLNPFSPYAVARLYIVIHDIEEVSCSSLDVQLAYRTIATCPVISILASISSIHAPLLWSTDTLTSLKFSFYHTPTMIPYPITQEIYDICDSFHSSKKAKTMDIESIKQIMKNLTKKHKQLLQCISKEIQSNARETTANNPQITAKVTKAQKKKAPSSHQSVTWAVFREMVMKDLIVKNESELRSLMTELLDHRLLREYTDSNNIIHVELLINIADLENALKDDSSI